MRSIKQSTNQSRGFGGGIFLRLPLLALLLIILFNSTALAASGNPDASLYLPGADVRALTEQISKATGLDIVYYENSGSLVKFKNVKYSNLNARKKRDFMEMALTMIRDSSLANTSRIKMFNFVSQQDSELSSLARHLSNNVKADFLEGWEFIKPLTGTINVILGVMVWVIMLAILGRLTFDVGYLADIPILYRLFQTSKETKPKIISSTAWNVKKSNADETTSTLLFTYFKESVLAIVLLSILVTLLISGGIFNIIHIVQDVFGI